MISQRISEKAQRHRVRPHYPNKQRPLSTPSNDWKKHSRGCQLSSGPPTGIDPAVVAGDEEVEVVWISRQRADRGTRREEATDRPPVVVDPRPVATLVPP